MYYAADRQKAERVLVELRGARLHEAAATLAFLHRLRNEVACQRAGEHLRMQAWMSIRRLYDAFKAAPERDLKALWQDAITKTAAWCDSLRVSGERAS
ncbi:MAG: hypothetical protein WDO17_24655 [Alphaproteobacteria bacterium]